MQRPLADSYADASITLLKLWAFGRRPLMIEISATSFMSDTECSHIVVPNWRPPSFDA